MLPSWSRPHYPLLGYLSGFLLVAVSAFTHLQPIQGEAREIWSECPAVLITPLLRTLQGPSHQPGSGQSPQDMATSQTSSTHPSQHAAATTLVTWTPLLVMSIPSLEIGGVLGNLEVEGRGIPC